FLGRVLKLQTHKQGFKITVQVLYIP
ncbi:hypothetical protein BMETH_8681073115149, partial [methanotrophic bacterial endosymbiont of Bathymodiolus sp.]